MMAQTIQPQATVEQHEQKSALTLFLLIHAGGMVPFLFRTLLHTFSLYRVLGTEYVSRTGEALLVNTE